MRPYVREFCKSDCLFIGSDNELVWSPIQGLKVGRIQKELGKK